MIDNRKRVIGTWAPVSHRRFRDGQFFRDTMGPDPRGRIVYDASGKMATFLTAADRKSGEHAPNWSGAIVANVDPARS